MRGNTSKQNLTLAERADFLNPDGLDRTRSIGPQVYELVRLAIILEKLTPGETINETELSEVLDISRTPVREAYQKLIEDGLIQSRAKSGTVVSPIDEARVKEGMIIRRALEREVVGILCASKLELRPLDEILALQSVAVSHGDHIAFFKHDESFHAALAELAGLPSAWRLAHSVKSHTDRARIVLTGNLPNRINVAFNEHLSIVDAIKSNDCEMSRALISKHINSVFEAVDDDTAP